jgi:hypothetical protein
VNPEGNITLGRSGFRWKDTIHMGVNGIGWKGLDWISLAQDGKK